TVLTILLLFQESNGPSDAYAAISNADRLQAEPESLRKWREEQRERLEELDANSRQQETEWKEKAKVELEEWHARQNEQLEKTKTNNRYCSPGRIETGWKINKNERRLWGY
ncbi:clathrin light chain A-like, partial [Neolamprologus brichardi]|uniref:clathrin light chain A-like n=1 Tax=Neolamprologus brichardi TaxID=32507 RepID=UPI001643F6DB